MNDTPHPILKSHQFFHACRRILGQAVMGSIYKRSDRQLYRWAADPNFCEDHERNPIDSLKIVLERLCEMGREDVALGGVEILASVFNCRVAIVPRSPAQENSKSLAEECLDDLPAVAQYHEALMKKRSVEEIRHYRDAAIRELHENFQVYEASIKK
jgi:hypothetical protein